MSELKVFLAGAQCGVLEQPKDGNLSFRYLEDYGDHQTPISLAMPPRSEGYPKARILPFLQGLLPDNESALRAVAARYSVSYRNPFAILSYVGGDVAGALQFFPADADDFNESESSRPVTNLEVEQLLLEKITEYSSGQPQSGAGLFSLAGAQPKLALHKNEQGWFTGSQARPTTHILKPMPEALPDLDLVELFTMELARQLGLKVAEVSFEQFGKTRVLVAARYDRKLVSGKLTRVHQEDFLQALGISPFKKYQKLEGGPGLKQIAGLFRMVPAVDRFAIVEGFYRAFVFNVLVRGTDAHAKNYSLLLQEDRVSLAPLYDLISGAAFPNALESAMSVGGEYRFDSISDAALTKEGELLGVDNPGAVLTSLREELPGAIERALEVVRDQLPAPLHPRLKEIVDRLKSFGQ